MGQIVSNKIALLITGTIVPNSSFVVHKNIEQRRNEYMEGLLFYSAQFPNNDIYFLENSSFEFKDDVEFQKLFIEKNITLLKFPVSTKFSEGKGYQEFEMLDASVEKLSSKYDSFIKITGRYKVLNLKELVSTKCENMIADSHKKSKVTQTNVFYVTTVFYNRYLKGLYLKVNDTNGRYIEHLVYEKLMSESVLKNVNLFKENPLIIGFSGSYGGTLKRNKYKLLVRNIERKILKLIGIHQFIIEY